MVSLIINGKAFETDVEPDTPLLWAIRENVGLTGTKYGCGIAQCGACTVHMDGVATRSCGVLVSEAVGKQITTIEGLATNGVLNKVQQAWIANDVPQCGYCQSGMIMAVTDTPQGETEADRRGYQRSDHEYLPVRHLPAGARGDPRCRERLRRRDGSTAPIRSSQLRHR
jgi:isoquinoline 1-oxidoreductase alpha subunit